MMLELLRQYFDNLHDRVRSPILGSITAVFLALNWKPLYFLVFSDFPVQLKIWYFEMFTSIYSLIVFPVLVGVAIGLARPWLTLFSAWAASLPKFRLHNLQYLEASKRETQKLRIDAEREDAKANLEASTEERKIAAAERLEKAAGVSQEFRDELEKGRIWPTEGANNLPAIVLGDSAASVINRQVVMALGEANSRLTLAQLTEVIVEHMERNNQGLRSALQNELMSKQRVSVETRESVESLKKIDVIQSGTAGGKVVFELTSTGYEIFDTLNSDRD